MKSSLITSGPPSRRSSTPSVSTTALPALAVVVLTAASAIHCLASPVNAETSSAQAIQTSIHPFCLPDAINHVVGASAVTLLTRSKTGSTFRSATAYFGGRECANSMDDMCIIDDNEYKLNHTRGSYDSTFKPHDTAHHCCAVDQETSIMACFGGTSASHLVYRYSMHKSIWLPPIGASVTNAQISTLGLVRQGHACSVIDSEFYVWGGVDSEGRDIAEAMISINLKKPSHWKPVKSAKKFGRHGHSIIQIGRELIALFGQPSAASDAASIISFNVDTGVFTSISTFTPLPIILDGVSCSPLYKRSASAAPIGIFCAGGRLRPLKTSGSPSAYIFEPFDRLLYIDLSTLHWFDLGALPAPQKEWGMTLSVHMTETATLLTLHGGSRLPVRSTSAKATATDIYKVSTSACATLAIIPTTLYYLISATETEISGIWMTSASVSTIVDLTSFEDAAKLVVGPSNRATIAATDPLLMASYAAYFIIFALISGWLVLYCCQRQASVSHGIPSSTEGERQPLMSSYYSVASADDSYSTPRTAADDFDPSSTARGFTAPDVSIRSTAAAQSESSTLSGDGYTVVVPAGATTVTSMASTTTTTTSSEYEEVGSTIPRNAPVGTLVNQISNLITEKGVPFSTTAYSTNSGSESSTNATSSLIITLTKQTTNPETSEVLEKTDFTLDIPGYALNGWWQYFLSYLSSNCTSFDVPRFLAVIAESATLTDGTLLSALHSSGAPDVTAEELERLKAEIIARDGASMLQLLGFVREALLLVGTQLVLQQVIPLFDYNVQSSSTASVTTTQSTTTTANETVLPDLLPGGTIVGQSYNRVVSVPFSSNVAIGDSIESRIIETDTATEETTSIVITLTKNTIDAETNMIVDSQEFTVEIPSYALYGWWSRMITFIQTRSKTLDIIVFLNVLAELEDLNDDLLLAAFKSAGCGLTVEELGLIKKDASPSDELGLARLFQFLQTTVKLVGADLVAEQVLPLFDYNITTANSSTTVNEMGTTSKDVIVVDQENSTTLHSNETTTTSTSVIEITLTKQSVDPVTNLVIDTQEFNFEIPLSHLDGWWYKLVTTITTRFTSFNILMFIERISTCSNLTESSLLEAFASAGAPMTVNELADFTNDAGIKDDLLVRLSVIREAVILVGADLVEQQVLPIFDQNAPPFLPTASAVTTTETETTKAEDASATADSTSSIEITLTKQTVNHETGAIVDSVDYTIVVPSAALHGWWRRIVSIITTRHSTFNTVEFLNSLASNDTCSSDADIVRAISYAGAPISSEELTALKYEVSKDGATLLELLTFLRKAILLVGVDLVHDQVLPLFDHLVETTTTTIVEQDQVQGPTVAVAAEEVAKDEIIAVELKETPAAPAGATDQVDTAVVSSTTTTTTTTTTVTDTSVTEPSVSVSALIPAPYVTEDGKTVNPDGPAQLTLTLKNSTEEVNVVVPEHAKGNWWTLLLQAITRRFSGFDSSAFLEAISKHEEITETTIVETLNQCGATVTKEELVTIQDECGCKGEASLVNLLTFVKRIIKIVGVTTFLTTVVSTLETSTSTVTTTTTTSTEETTGTAAPTSGEEVVFVDLKETAVVVEDVTATTTTGSAETCEPAAVVAETVEQVVETTVVTEETTVIDAAATATTAKKPAESWFSKATRIVKDGAVAAGGAVLHAGEVAGSAVAYGAQAAGSTVVEGVTVVGSAVKSGAEAAGSAAVSGATSAGSLISDGASAAGSALKYTAGAVGTAAVVGAVAVGAAAVGAGELAGSAAKTVGTAVVEGGEVALSSTVSAVKTTAGVAVDAAGAAGSAITYVADATGSAVVSGAAAVAGLVAGSSESAESVTETVTTETITTTTTIVEQDQVQGPTVAVAAEEVAKDEIIAVELKETPAAPAGATDQVDTAVVSSTTTTTTTTTTVTDTSVTEPSVSVSALIPAPYVTEDGKTVNPDGPAQLTLTLKNSTEEVNVVVPEHAKGNWWTLLLQAITRRFSGFDSSAFLEAISKHEEITETTIVETLNQCGATVTKEELVTIQDECGCKGEASLVNLLTFVKRIIKIVGVTTFLTTVVSTLETSTSTVTTTTTTSTEETTGTAAPTSGEEVVFVDLKETAVVVEDVTATTTTGSAETCEPAAVVAETVEQVVETTVVTEETTVIDAAATATTAKKPAESWFSKATRIVKDGAVAAGGAVLHAGEVAGSAVAYGAQAAGSTVVEGVTVVGSAVKSGAEAAGSAAVSGATSAGSLISDGASAAGSALKYTAGAVGTAAVVGAVAVGAAAVGAGELAGSAAKTVGTAVVEGGEVALSSTVSAVKTTAGVAVDAAGAAGSAITYVADATGSAVVSGAAAVAGLVAGSSESAESVTETVTTETITTTTTIVEQDQVQGPTVAVAAEEVAKDEIIAVELKETPAAPAGATDQVDTAVVSSTTTTTTTTTTVTDTSVTEPSVSVSALIPAPYVTEDGKTVNPDGPAQLTLTLKNSTEEVNVVVPEHAKGNWWTLLLQAITRRFSGFDSSAFLEAISKHEEITETTIVETLNQCGATVTKEELVTIQDECGCKGEASLVNLLTFVKRIIKIVGVTTFLTTVVSTLETSTSTVTTTTTTSTEETTGTAAPTSGEEVVFVDLKETAVVVEDVTATTTTGSAETCEPAAVVAETVEHVVKSAETFTETAETESLVVTLTQQTLDESNNVISSNEVTLEIPSSALGSWWSSFVLAVSSKHSSFHPKTFVSCLVAAPDASDASVLAALKSAEAPLALDEFAGVKAATGADFDLHLAFVKSAGETVGSDLFVDQVAPILESSV